ncbi:MAG: tRNA (adenosine(37)-N6)-threonylcarbamoyltransferase complex dimerization subunit type 1 TsaB [Gammaproteobacteria bacterium]
MKILAIETATHACSAALLLDGEVRQSLQIAPREHVRLILPMVESLLQEADIKLAQLDAIAFGRGPGSFTGLRIAAGIAQGMAFAADLPVVPVSTLAAIAQGIIRQHQKQRVLVAIDARMQEVYWAAWRQDKPGNAELQGQEQVTAPEDVRLPDDSVWSAAGNGWEEYQQQLLSVCHIDASDVFSQQYPEARDVATLAKNSVELGNVVSADLAQPIYLRDNVARKPAPK